MSVLATFILVTSSKKKVLKFIIFIKYRIYFWKISDKSKFLINFGIKFTFLTSSYTLISWF